ncbi:hypothetical protein E1A91_A10G168300v1 [Gossypium mustelinum]|uniref:Uncharacterized protein n=1 Tax=Gossypium mustelinum TaxID=34275 RepID=A0A5D2XMI0_GOSMU|nr:hypothetical protein E1A91_A10G168300v1 [Gossypium mustelinum]
MRGRSLLQVRERPAEGTKVHVVAEAMVRVKTGTKATAVQGALALRFPKNC